MDKRRFTNREGRAPIQRVRIRVVTGSGTRNFRRYYESELGTIKWNTDGQGTAKCPFHDDHRPSLSVDSKKGLFNCHTCGARGNLFEFHKKKHGMSFEEAFSDLRKKGIVSSNMVRAYDYRDESGKVLFQVVRYYPKSFSLRRPDGKGGWINNIRGVTLVPYNLVEVIDADIVYIVEGENDADTLTEFGLVATCNPMGAGKWKTQYNEHFTDKKVRIIADHDDVGREHALNVARNLKDIAASIKMIDLPGLGDKQDVTDWVEKGGTRKELIRIVRETPLWTDDEHEGNADGLTSIGKLLSRPEQKIDWLVDEMLPLGGLSILAAKPKVGKSTLARFLAVCIAQGEPFLGREVKEGGVIYYGLEEIMGGIKEDFESMGAKKTDDIHIFEDAISSNPIDQLRRHIENRRPALVIIDTLFRFIRSQDANNYAQMTQALDPLMHLARETGTHILCVHHMNKGLKQGQDSVLGSTAIAGTFRTMILMKRRGDQRTIMTEQNYGEDLEESELIFDKETRTLHIGNIKTDMQVTGCENNIYQFLSTQHEPVTEAVIDQEVVGRKEFKVKALRNLMAKRKLSRTGVGRKKDPFKYSYVSYSHNLINMSGTRKQESQTTRKSLSTNDYSSSHKVIKRVRLREQEPNKRVIVHKKNNNR